MTEERKANEATQEQNNATRAEISGQQQGRTFTQEEVNAIVRDRLTREREKAAPQTDEREKEISAREARLDCREYISENSYPAALLDVFCTDNVENFKNSVDKLLKAFPMIAEQKPPMGTGSTGNFGFVLAHPSATVAPVKLDEYKIHQDPPGISGSLVEGRICYDAFVLENKKKALYYQEITPGA